MAPASVVDIEVAAGLEFDVSVRSETDRLAVTIETFRLRGRRQIPIVELSA